MDPKLVIALSGALVNMILAVTIPCLLNKTDQPFLKDMERVFKLNREVIIASSIIVAITIYLALAVAPSVDDLLSELTSEDDVFMRPSYSRDDLPLGLPQLVQLRNGR